MRKILIAIAMASVAALATAPVDTSLVLKPTPEQIKAAHAVGNKKCPVSGEEIGGSMGEGKTVIYKGQAVQLCCSTWPWSSPWRSRPRPRRLRCTT